MTTVALAWLLVLSVPVTSAAVPNVAGAFPQTPRQIDVTATTPTTSTTPTTTTTKPIPPPTTPATPSAPTTPTTTTTTPTTPTPPPTTPAPVTTTPYTPPATVPYTPPTATQPTTAPAAPLTTTTPTPAPAPPPVVHTHKPGFHFDPPRVRLTDLGVARRGAIAPPLHRASAVSDPSSTTNRARLIVLVAVGLGLLLALVAVGRLAFRRWRLAAVPPRRLETNGDPGRDVRRVYGDRMRVGFGERGADLLVLGLGLAAAIAVAALIAG